jgi:hypothetical protein
MTRSWYIGLRYWRPKRPGDVDARKWVGNVRKGVTGQQLRMNKDCLIVVILR